MRSKPSMSDVPIRNRPLRQLAWFITVAAVMTGAILVASGIYLLLPPVRNPLGTLDLAAGLILMVFGLLSHVLILLLLKTEANVNRIHHDTLDVLDLLKRVEPLIQSASDNTQISDAARSIAHRERERDMLRQ